MVLNTKTKKYLCVIALIQFTFLGYSQVRMKTSGAASVPIYLKTIAGKLIEKSNDVHKNYALYYYPTYTNTALILTSSGEKYKLLNINYNIYKNNFDFEISKDSVYVIDNTYISSITINGKVFKEYIDDNHNNRIYQTVYENDNFSFLREDKIVSSEIKDPLNQAEPKIKLTRLVLYYFENKKENNYITEIKLNKKSILELFDDNGDLLKDFIKKNKLSIKDESDLIRIFEYCDEHGL
ncbi:hypothetical protein ACS386_09845 [Flavobacteriaceae bacterium LMO-SS05]